MNKPNNYDETKTGGAFERIAPGPHTAVIKNVIETQSKAGNDMIVVSIDFAAEDPQAGYFKKQFDEDTRAGAKWPFAAVSYILVTTEDGKTNRSFKSFCTAFQDSNGIKELKWGDAFAKQFIGKKIGVMYGQVEDLYQGELKTRTRIRWFFDTHKADEQTTPEVKHLKTEASTDDFMKVPVDTDELPFN